ncbi:MAG: lactate utilization protein [Dethiosulfovibrio peptidovorans]|nr:MAG: lactate utilization protein [Dethiosulfovibrio peptidovorans]
MSMQKTPGFDTPQLRWNRRLGSLISKNLIDRGHDARYVDTKQEAKQTVLDIIPANASVGVPGTVTIREIGAVDALIGRGNRLVQHWLPSSSKEEKNAQLSGELTCDFFLTSSNAITKDGILVNMDGRGNRLAGMCWGTGTIVYVIGLNKVCENLESAILRVQNYASPLNALRLGVDFAEENEISFRKNKALQNIGRILLITEQAPMGRDSRVILVGESCGY